MSLILFDSAKKYVDSFTTAGGIIGRVDAMIVVEDGGRDGGPTFNETGNSNNSGIRWTLPRTFSPGDVIIVGMHIFMGVGTHFLQLGNMDFAFGGTAQCRLRRNQGTGVLEFVTGTNTLQISSDLSVATQQHYFIEMKLLLASDATGSVHVRVDGTDFIGGGSGVDGSNIQTMASANDITAIGVGTCGNLGRFDVFYVCDDEGDHNNDFLGNVATVKPAINSDHSVQFTPSEGEDNYAMVAEDPSDEDDTYNASDNLGDKDLFGHANGLTSDSIFGAQVAVRRRKDASGLLGMKVVAASNGTEVRGDLRVPTTTYAYDYIILDSDPATGEQWTANGANGLKAGYELSITP